MKKKGFTLVELLAVIGIIVLISLLLMPKVARIIEENRTKGYKEIENRLKIIGQQYMIENYISLNTNTIIVSKEQLILKNYIEEIKDLKDNSPCNAKIILTNLLTKPIIKSSIECSNYQTSENQKIINLTIDLDGGSMVSNPEGLSLSDTIIPLSVPTKSDKLFAGWEIIGNSLLISNGNSLKIGTEDTTIKAIWIKPIILTLNLDGGIISTNPSGLYLPGETIEIPIPTKPGQIFRGWEVPGNLIPLSGNNFTIGTEDITIQAIWRDKTLLIINLDGGTISQNPSGLYSPRTEIPLSIPTRPDYDFVEWQIELGNDSSLNENNLLIGIEDTKIKAIWEPKIELEVDLDGGNLTSNLAGFYSKGSTIPLPIPTRPNYDFVEWQIESGNNSFISANNLTIGTEKTRIKAKWNPNKWQITYNCNGGQGSTASHVWTYGTTSILPANGCYKITAGSAGMVYYFKGWAKTSTATTVLFTDKQNITNSAQITSNTTLYAVWGTLFTITGNYEVINDGTYNWRLKIKGAAGSTYGSASIVFNKDIYIDIFAVGGGAGGGANWAGDINYAGGGGGSGYTETYIEVPVSEVTVYSVVVGDGGAAGTSGTDLGKVGGQSYFYSTTYKADGGLAIPNCISGSSGGSGGGSGGYRYEWTDVFPGGVGGIDGGNGSYSTGGGSYGIGTGQGTTTREFGAASGTLYAQGGSGGWNSTTAPQLANSGNGGNAGTKGSSGIVILRNHR